MKQLAAGMPVTVKFPDGEATIVGSQWMADNADLQGLLDVYQSSADLKRARI